MDVSEPFISLVIYPSNKDAQARQADNLLKLVAEKVRLQPGFLRGRVFLSEDGESLLTLTVWNDRDSFRKFRESEFGRAAILLTADLHPKAYWLSLHATVEAP
jgi:heme-degrading monooxygenase HmoA